MNIPQIIYCPDPVPQPTEIKPATPSSAFRLKGCRYKLIYPGHIPKEVYYVWFKEKLIGRTNSRSKINPNSISQYKDD